MKKLLILISCLFITGCNVEYKINIDEDLKVIESVQIAGGDELYKTYYKTSKNKVLSSLLDLYKDILNQNNYEYNLVKGIEPHVGLERKYANIGDYIDNTKLLNDYFEKIKYEKKDDVKHHDLEKIKKNINQHRYNMNKNNKKK